MPELDCMCTATVQEFDAYIQDAMVNPKYTPQERRQLLLNWEQASCRCLAPKMILIMHSIACPVQQVM